VPPTNAHVKTSGKEFAFGLIWDIQKELYMGLFFWGALGLQGEKERAIVKGCFLESSNKVFIIISAAITMWSKI
jgi:hypothetical protein